MNPKGEGGRPLDGAASEIDISKLPGMVAWYSPALLAETGSRHLISRIFGQFADQRIMQATVDGFAPEVLSREAGRHDYSAKPEFIHDGAFWVDFVADLGDGFDSTFAMASLISADHLDLAGAGRLPGSRLLIMGGDQVYPFPTRQAYRERLETPYSLALPAPHDPKAPAKRHLFVLPGNHDWYDGLSSFDFMFCKARYGLDAHNRIGGWLCPQRRSYFALKLPHNWWIWGADIQMSQYLDAGQVLYFQEVARQMAADPTEAPKVIFCIAEPSWQIADRQNLQGEGNLDIITEIAVNAGARVCAVLAGDLHHYSRYKAPELGLNFITSGGGGAYFSPTHWLEDKVELNWSKQKFDLYMTGPENGTPEGSPASCWPSRGESRKMSIDILAFPFHNYWFSACLGLFYWVMTWQFAETTVRLKSSVKEGNVEQKVVQWLMGPGEIINSPLDLGSLVLFAGQRNALLGLLGIGLFVVLWLYANAPGQPVLRVVMATLHWWAHVLMMMLLMVAFIKLNTWILGTALPAFGITIPPSNDWYEIIHGVVLPPFEMTLLGAIGAGLVWGAYLTICCLFGRHCDEAFSSMRVDKFKHFMRLKIEPEKLTIFPVGLENIPSRRSWRKAQPDADGVASGPRFVPTRPLKPRLIEPPVVVRVADIKWRDPAMK